MSLNLNTNLKTPEFGLKIIELILCVTCYYLSVQIFSGESIPIRMSIYDEMFIIITPIIYFFNCLVALASLALDDISVTKTAMYFIPLPLGSLMHLTSAILIIIPLTEHYSTAGGLITKDNAIITDSQWQDSQLEFQQVISLGVATILNGFVYLGDTGIIVYKIFSRAGENSYKKFPINHKLVLNGDKILT